MSEDTGIIRDFHIIETLLKSGRMLSHAELGRVHAWENKWARNVQLSRLVRAGLIRIHKTKYTKAVCTLVSKADAQGWVAQAKKKLKP